MTDVGGAGVGEAGVRGAGVRGAAHLARARRLAEAAPHEFTLQYPPRREYFREQFRTTPAPLEPASLPETLGLYLHIPFCEQHCSFCNFAVDIRRSPEVHRRYLDALLEQLEYFLPALCEREILGLDIGGGTPTGIDALLLERLLAALQPLRERSLHPHPWSVETTPSIAASHPERLAALRAGGVDRVSMGVQSASGEVLEHLGRPLQRSRATHAVANLRGLGFPLLAADLIFGLPEQSDVDWRLSLDHALSLDLDTITTYDCLYRGKGRLLTRRTEVLPSPERYRHLYDLGYAHLTAAGYTAPYGGLNFSRAAHSSGTSPYFEARLLHGAPYLGLGNYSSTQVDRTWCFAPYTVKQFEAATPLQRAVGERYELPVEELEAKELLAQLSFGVLAPAHLPHAGTLERVREMIEAGEEEGILLPAHSAPYPGLDPTPTQPVWLLAPGRFDTLPLLRAMCYAPQALTWLEALRRQV